MKRKANAIWKGSIKEGKGHLNAPSGVFDDTPYSFKTRFENEDGKAGTNPEELIGAAHAGCFAMALSLALGEEGFTPDELNATAEVNLKQVDDGFEINEITLNLKGKVKDISSDKFKEIAKEAKEGCPVSKVLAGAKIHLNAELVS